MVPIERDMKQTQAVTGSKESQFYSLPFTQAVASIY